MASKYAYRSPTVVCFAVVIAFIAGLAAPAWSAPPANEGSRSVSFFLEPILQKGLGGTSYDISFNLSAPGYMGLSRLEFPQLALEAGLAAGLSVYEGEKREWLVEATVAHSAIGFSGSMNDYDWEQYLAYPKVPFSYTYSADTTTSWHVSAEVGWTIAYAKPWSLALYGTYRYQSLSHVEDGVTGWQYVPDATNDGVVPVVFSDTTPDVLEYTLSSHTIGVGLMGELAPSPDFSFELRAAFTPVYASDSDDHKLRTKLSTASGWGTGFYGDLRATYLLSRSPGVTPYLALEGEVIYYVVSTTQTQYWYGNADAANGSPQGTLRAGIGDVITSTQYQVGLRFGIMF